VNLYHKWEGLQEAKDLVDSKKVQRGFERGLRKVGDRIAVQSPKIIRESYNLKAAQVKGFKVYAQPDSVTITCNGRPVNLTSFNPKQYGSSGGKRVTTRRIGDTIQSKTRGRSGVFGGVAVNITRDKTTLLGGSFIAKVAAGKRGAFNIGVFHRAGYQMKSHYTNPYKRTTNRPYNKTHRAQTSYREAIINKAFVSVPTLFTSHNVVDKIWRYVETDAIKVVMHEILWSQGAL
jgi:hypothetical protein